MRKREVVTITAEGRDKGKSFLLTEMSAADAEDWAAEMFLLASGAGIGDEGSGGGMAELLGLDPRMLAGVPWDRAKPLWDRMFQCVSRVVDVKDVDAMTGKPVGRPLIDNPANPDGDDIEEPGTRLKLRMEVFELHTGFSIAALLSILGRAAQARISSNTQTSPEPSAALSEEGMQA